MRTLAKRLMNEGEKKGIREEKLETARRLLSDNVPIEDIVKYTGLSKKEVKALMH